MKRIIFSLLIPVFALVGDSAVAFAQSSADNSVADFA